MFKRLLLIVIGLVVLAACAKPPVNELDETRRIVAYAYASGASRLAADEYQAASVALQNAEHSVKQGKYGAARESLAAARAFSSRALSLALHRKQAYVDEQEKLAKKKVREAAESKAERERKHKAKKKEKLKQKLKQKQKPVSAVAKPELEPQLLDEVEVMGEDTLASISARKDVYNDPFLWTLIYKANRDQIKDPKQIFTGQILQIPRDKTAEELEAARAEAHDLSLF